MRNIFFSPDMAQQAITEMTGIHDAEDITRRAAWSALAAHDLVTGYSGYYKKWVSCCLMFPLP